uniref:H-type lectin domain-containing protein n=1 Tax=Euhadra quaesita TaxID=87842 RepID=A0A4Y1QE94_9EUPU|nr:hypothetical protein [Euhadra quaesita]
MTPLVACLTSALVFMGNLRVASSGADQYADLVKIHGLLKTADDRLVLLSTRNCQSGSGFVDFCPIAGKLSFSEVFSCFYNTITSGPVVKEVEIYFDSTFITKPNVAVFTSGISHFVVVSYNITVTKVTRTGLTIQAVGGPAPFSLGFNYVACDQQVLFPKAYLDIQDEIAFHSEQ